MQRCYETKLAAFRNRLERLGHAEGTAWQIAETEKGRLAFRLSEEGTVVEARHDRAGGDFELLLEALCLMAEGKPLEEIREHGTLTLEYHLRDPEVAPPVPGLVTPENADPLFQDLLHLVRLLPKSELRRAWTPPVPALWKAKPLEERKEILLTSLRTELTELGYDGPAIDLFPAPGTDRWLISFGDHGAPLNFFMLLLSLERKIRASTGTNVELFLEGKEDRNRRQGRDIRSHDLHPSA